MGNEKDKGAPKPSNGSGKPTSESSKGGRFTEKRGYGPGGETPRDQIPKPPTNKDDGEKK